MSCFVPLCAYGGMNWVAAVHLALAAEWRSPIDTTHLDLALDENERNSTELWQTDHVKSDARHTARVLQVLIGSLLVSTPMYAAAQEPEMTFEYGPGEGDSESTDDTDDTDETNPSDAQAEAPGPATAHRTPEPIVTAEEHFSWGASMYDNGDYPQALAEFQQAYVASGRSELFYNYSLCYQRMRQYNQAAVYLERYLLEVIVIDNRASLELRLHRLKESSDARAAVQEESVTLSPLVWIGVAVAGAGLVTFGVAGSLALLEDGRLADAPCAVTQTCDADTLWTRTIVADLGLGVALVGAGLAVVGLALSGQAEPSSNTEHSDADPSDPDAQPDTDALRLLTASPWISNESAGLVLTGEF